MNKYLEMMYEEAAGDPDRSEGCSFCVADRRMVEWVRKRFVPKLNPAYISCIFCPHAEYGNAPFMYCGGFVEVSDEWHCSEAGKRLWRKYRDFFEECERARQKG